MAGKITALRSQQRRRDRVNIYIDGAYAFSLQDILAAELHIGQTLDEAEVQVLQERDASESAYEATLRYLSFRPRSEQELRRYLARRALGEQTIDDILARLAQAGLTGDRQFAEFWVENREAFRPRGRWALRAELRQKGVETEFIDEALSEIDEDESALRAGEQVLRRYARDDEPTFYRRLMGHLQRRGFGFGVARRTAERLWRQLEAQRPKGD